MFTTFYDICFIKWEYFVFSVMSETVPGHYFLLFLTRF